MFESMVHEHEERKLSAWHLALVFLAGVAVCAIFFSLGFLVGSNERSGRMAPETERVTPTGNVPPAVNAPLETEQVGVKEAPKADASEAAPAKQEPSPAPVSAPSPRPKHSATSAAAAAPSGGYAIQVAAMGTRGDAEALVNVLKMRGYRVLLVAPGQSRAADNLYRVQVGPFSSRDQAEKVRAKLSQEGFKPFIRR
jgi:DedD protein